MKLTLIKKTTISRGVVAFKFSSGKKLDFKAGQYLRYELEHKDPDERGIFRFFTISSAPFEEYIMLTTRILEEGGSSFKKKLDSLDIGESLYAYGPMGEFVVGDSKQGSMLFIAGGIGITPFRSIILDLDHKGDIEDLRLLYCTKDEPVPFKKEFEKIEKRRKGLSIDYIKPPEICDIDVIKDRSSDFIERKVFVSGPIGMVQSLEKVLKSNGLGENDLKFDYFPGYKNE